LNLSYFISKRISKPAANTFSSTIYKIGIASVGISLATMILSFCILLGFRGIIEEKIISFGSHLNVTRFTLTSSYLENPISTGRDIYVNYRQYPFIDHIQTYSYKPALLKTEEEVLGAFLKGVAPDFNLKRFNANMAEGGFVEFDDSAASNDVVISKIIANKLKLKVGDPLIAHFFQNPPRVRRLNVKGIYETWIEEFDEKVILVDIKLIQRLNNWPDSLVGGFEVFIKDFNQLEANEETLYDNIDSDLYVEKVTDQYQQVFEWLGLIKQNMLIFLVLVLFVASFNMISIVIILIMERTPMIGMLKAMGAPDKQIRDIFTYNGWKLILWGLLIGNALGIGLGMLQDKFRLIPLNPENYYMSYVPISWNWPIIIGLNFSVSLLILLVLFIPTAIISRIQPIRSIRFD